MADTSDFRLPFNSLLNYVPKELRNPVSSSLISNLFDRFMTHDESVPLYGYVGRKPSSLDDRTPRVPQQNAERDINSVLPVLSFKQGTQQIAYTVEDLIAKAQAIGISPGGLQWLYSQGNNYLPPINLDKFTNFFNYYWVARSLEAVPDLSWNPELYPEYYTIALPVLSDLNKLNVVAATTGPVVMTGTGFEKLKFRVFFSDPTHFTITPIGSLGSYTPITSSFTLTNDDHFSYIVNGPAGNVRLIEFDITRDNIFDQYGNSAGTATFEAGDYFILDVTFLSRNYNVTFNGSVGIKGKISKLKALNTYQTIDGVLIRAGDRVLVKNANPSDSGIYVVSAGTWTRSDDFAGSYIVPNALVFAKSGIVNGSKLFKSLGSVGAIGWVQVAGVTTSNTNHWQEGNFWVKGDQLADLGLGRSDAIQAVRPIIEYDSSMRLNSFVNNGKPSDTGVEYKQVKSEFNQIPLFDLYLYDGTHAGLVSSIFYYEEDLTATLDLALQKRVKKSTNGSADFIFNHGMANTDGSLLFVKLNGVIKTIWHPGYTAPHVVDIKQAGAGNGTMTNYAAFDFTQQQIWTLTATSPTTFDVVGSKMPVLPSPYDVVNVGVPYASKEFQLTINQGSIPFKVGDVFIFRVGNLESPRYVYRDANDAIFDLYGKADDDINNVGAWQVPRTFYNNPYNDSRSEVTEGVLYSHFRGILANQIEGLKVDNAFGGSIKLWSEQQTLLASLLMQRDMTPVSMISLAQRQYETALNSVKDIFQTRIVQYIADNGPIENLADLDALLDWVLVVRSRDNDVRTVLYDSTSPVIGFPATLPQLGISELIAPTVAMDSILGRTLLVHHDGHLSPLFVDDLSFRQTVLGNLTTLQIKRPDGTYTPAISSFSTQQPTATFSGELWVTPDGVMRIWDDGAWKVINLADTLNSLMLRVETRLYEGINPNARKYDFSVLASDAEYNVQLEKELFTFAATNSYDPLGSDYNAMDPFTWNYSQASLSTFAPINTNTVPARWYSALKAHQAIISNVIPTERPNIEPWKLMGYADGNTWWTALSNPQRVAYTPFVQRDAIDGTYIDGGSVRVVKIDPSFTVHSGLQTIDGVSLNQGDLVLIQNDPTPSANGIWVVSSGGWTRSMTPLTVKTVISVSSGASCKGTTWVLTASVTQPSDPVLFLQARMWTTKMWEDIKAARPGLKISVNEATDDLLPPYVSSSNYWSTNALTNDIPSGVTRSYEFGQGSPVETVWRKSLEFGYSQARALFRYDPLAFLGFAWGFNWVQVDGILYDGADMQMPGHKRFRLHGEVLDFITRTPMVVVGSGAPLIITYTAYDSGRLQNFTVKQNGNVIGYVRNTITSSIGGFTFTIRDEGRPFRVGDRFEITAAGTAMFVPEVVHKILGFGQVFTHALRETSIDTQSSYAISAYREWDVNMGYRAGGLVATDDLVVYTDAETLSSSAYTLLFKKNPISHDEWVQALRITVTNFGSYIDAQDAGFVPTTDGSDWVFRIEGYNPRYLDISYYTMGGVNETFYALSKEHTSLLWYHPTVPVGNVSTHIPLTITGIQNVVNFLFGYERYLEDHGWEFNVRSEFNIDAKTGRVRNFQLEIEKFVDRCFNGLKLGQGHVINPFIDHAWFNQKTGLLSEFVDTSLFDITGHPGVFDILGVKYKKEDLNVVRTNVQSSFSATGPIFSAHIQVDDFEHIFIFNNFSQPSTESGVLYDPFSGGRIMTYKFNGRKQSTNTMRPEFGGHFLVGNEVKQNLQASTDNVANFYDSNRAFENETTTRHAMALLGFSTKQYFDDLDISDKTQFNFWRGLIQLKGTNMSVGAYLNNDRFDDAKIDEYWAYKVADYGDSRQHTFPELRLAVNDALTQFTQLQFDAVNPLEHFIQISRFDESRWFSIDDLNQDAYFKAEVTGTYVKTDQVAGQIIKLPFIADRLEGGNFTQINATTIRVTRSIGADADDNVLTIEPPVGPLTIVGYGPARPRFNPIKLFNYVDEELVEEIPMWHPATGVHTPNALESINIISDQNPAKYNYSTEVLNNNAYDPLRPWGAKEVGRIWLNTKNLDYLPYYDSIIFPNLDERLSRWGTLADYATIDVHEWVQSTVPPSEYNALAQTQAGDANLDPATKAAGEVASQQTYVRTRNWFMRPIAWSYSPIPVDVDWGATPPFPGGSTDAELSIADGYAVLNKGTFAEYGIFAGMRLGAWNNNTVKPKPLSEYLIENISTNVIRKFTGGYLTPITVASAGIAVIPATVTLVAGNPTVNGQLVFTPLLAQSIPTDYDENGNPTLWTYEAPIRVTSVDSGIAEDVNVTEAIDIETSTPQNHVVQTGDQIIINFPQTGISAVVSVITGGSYAPEALRNTLVNALGNQVALRNAMAVTPILDGSVYDMSNELDDTNFTPGWRVWNVPTQAQLDADGMQPNSSWKPYVGDYVSIPGNLAQVQDAVAYAKSPLTTNDGIVIERYMTTWNNWNVLDNIIQEQTSVLTGQMTFTFDENIDSTRTSVYVNGIAQLKAAFTIDGKNLTITSVTAGAEATVIVRKYEPTAKELAFNPSVEDNLAFQSQYKQDYEYVSLPVRDRDGALTSVIYYFWVKNKTTAATGKKLSVQSITQELRDGPPNYLTFQHYLDAEVINNVSYPRRYDAVTISGLSYAVTKDDTFKLRFTRNFTLRDNPEDLNLKNVHNEWSLMRSGQKIRVPESLWQKLTDSVAGADAAGNAVPAIRRVLYDERNGSSTRYGFGPEQTLAPQELLRSSITYAILNTKLLDTTISGTPVPDYITFLDFNESNTWFATAAAARRTMTDIWNSGKVAQVNEIFFAALNDVLAANYELSDIFKTSRLSAYSIKVVRAAPVEQTFE